MFDLDKNITAWRDSFLADKTFSIEQVDELEGHLQDRIDGFLAEGLPEEQAFQCAIVLMGDRKVLRRIYRAQARDEHNLKRYAILFLLFGAVNLFLLWTEPLWLRILPFLEPEVLVNPVIDKVLAALSYALVTIQIPAGIIIDFFESFRQFNVAEGLFIFSALSAGFFELYRQVWFSIWDRLTLR